MSEPIFLYVEDDPMSRMVMEMLVTRRLGYSQITIFEDSTDFMPRLMLLPAKPTVIFLDIHMTPHNGFALLEMLRSHEDFYDIPVVALTASVMNEEVDMLKTSGFNGVIAKPINHDTFPDVLESILRGDEIWQIN